MNKEEQMICSHLLDLAEACDRRGYPMGSDFLTLNEQNLFLAFSKDKLPPVSMEMCGGYELAERKIYASHKRCKETYRECNQRRQYKYRKISLYCFLHVLLLLSCFSVKSLSAPLLFTILIT